MDYWTLQSKFCGNSQGKNRFRNWEFDSNTLPHGMRVCSCAYELMLQLVVHAHIHTYWVELQLPICRGLVRIESSHSTAEVREGSKVQCVLYCSFMYTMYLCRLLLSLDPPPDPDPSLLLESVSETTAKAHT